MKQAIGRVAASIVVLAGITVVGPLAVAATAASVVIHVPADQPTIQAAINAARRGDAVVVSPGTYAENIDFKGKAITVRSASGPAVTTIDGGGHDSVVRFHSGEKRTSRLTGFTITNGFAYPAGNYFGGGVSVASSSPTIAGNVITNNRACSGGGGIDSNFGSPRIEGNTISLNAQAGCSGGSGGGIEIGGASNAELVGNTISQNTWGSDGGGISLFASGPAVIKNNVITGNARGAIVIVNDSPAKIVQNLIVDNPGGAAINVSPPSGTHGPTFVNNTVVAASGTPGVFAGGFDSTTSFFNNVIVSVTSGVPAVNCDTTYSPTPPKFTKNDAFAGGGPSMVGSCASVVGKKGNISSDPKFVGANDFHVTPTSPVIDAGTNSAPSMPTSDLDGHPRVVDGDGDGSAVIDMGVYELTPAAPGATVTMGSPVGHLGNDPDNGATDQLWLNIGAPGVDKRTGDRFADYRNCTSGVFGCTGGINTEYSDGTYVFNVDVPVVPVGGVDIQVYDPEYADSMANCDNQWLTTAQINQLMAQGYSDAATRFANGANNYCAGDDFQDLGTPQAAVWLVRDSSVSSVDPLANPIVTSPGTGQCAHQFKGYNPPVNDVNYWYDLLDKTSAAGRFDPDFAASFHRYYTVCHVTVPGRYFLQARSSVPFGASDLSKTENPPENATIAGQNRYSIRAVNTGTTTVTASAMTYAPAHLPVYANVTSATTPNFYLARMVPSDRTTTRFLDVQVFDVEGVNGPASFSIVPPVDAVGSPPICTQWTVNGSSSNPMPGGTAITGCTLSGLSNPPYPSGSSGALISVRVQLPGDYNCNVADPFACWFKIRLTYSGGARSNDTMTWSAAGGDTTIG